MKFKRFTVYYCYIMFGLCVMCCSVVEVACSVNVAFAFACLVALVMMTENTCNVDKCTHSMMHIQT